MTPAFVGFIAVALVGGAAEMAAAFSGAHKKRPDVSVGIALGRRFADRTARSAGAAELRDWPDTNGPAVWPRAVFIATLTGTFVTNTGRSAWFVGVLMLMVYPIFAMNLYPLPPCVQ